MLKNWVFDGHNDLPEVLRANAGYSVAGLDQGRPQFQTDLPRLRAGGVGAQFWSAWVPPELCDGQAVKSTLEQIDAIHRMIAAYPDQLAFAVTGDDVRAAVASGRIASLIGLEGGHSVGRSPAVLRMFARLGARYMTLTHGDNVAWADSATDEPGCGGLTDEGRAMIAEMERLGVIVDLSHVAATTMRDALDVVTRPVLFSHSSAFAVTPHPRNVPDDVLERVAVNEGVVQATFVPGFVCTSLFEWETAFRAWAESSGLRHDYGAAYAPAPRAGETAEQAMTRAPQGEAWQAWADAKARYEADHPRPEATLDDVVAHVQHLREVAGVDHVGLGGDYDGTEFQPKGLEDVSGYPRLLAALAELGWSHDDLTKLAHGNVLRVLDANPVG